MSEVEQTMPLKRLQFVKDAAEQGMTKAGEVYTASKGYTGPLKSSIETLEGAFVHYSMPIVSKTQEIAPKILSGVDTTVDQAFGAAEKRYSSYSAAAAEMLNHSDNLAHFQSMREEYLKRIEEAVAFVKAKNVSERAQEAAAVLTAAVADARTQLDTRAGEAAGAVTAAAATARERLDARAVMDKVAGAWASFLATPAVAGALAQSSPMVAGAWERYETAVKSVQADPRFTRAVEGGGKVITTVQENKRYKTYVEPYVEYVASNKQVAAAVNMAAKVAETFFPAPDDAAAAAPAAAAAAPAPAAAAPTAAK